ncbi:hypothetical protein KSD_78680 [Ktedonobacter sp. SOSP1-85]|uniref:hypothetical protein n=1 Tax=Ktedonobacter sp. SOSP1-85 TaxID=2778367 RepID=UPI0019166264|nr:hypothetical protein [Ktedonobacter sp. SOSP1-85]GHO80097.1 hypothetical protein KSD_78680 [Ktedonobacter sp. SOSP1-85]
MNLPARDEEQASTKPPKCYWWRSQKSCSVRVEYHERLSVNIDFATSIRSGQEPIYASEKRNFIGSYTTLVKDELIFENSSRFCAERIASQHYIDVLITKAVYEPFYSTDNTVSGAMQRTEEIWHTKVRISAC